ncbi:hypothetical protein Tco_0756871 [Tanacetum coccineum]
MDLYHSRLTQDDLNDLIIKYKIPRDLHPRLPSEEVVMSELPDDAIGIYHRIFDFYGVRIPFSSFLLALIKHYGVHFSQLGPLGLNKTLCKQGDWFSFAKRHAPSSVCIDDNRSCMKHWKSGFFLIDQRVILDSMVWRHLSAAIDDPWPTAGSFSMADVRCLSAHVIKLRDMPKRVLVLSRLIRVLSFFGVLVVTSDLTRPSISQILQSVHLVLAHAVLAGLLTLLRIFPLPSEDDLDDLIIKYKILRNLHPRLPSKEFMMFELPTMPLLGPLGLNKVITFEVLCRSLQIEPTVTLFRVFQTLCKQGDWFSFAKRRAPSLAIPDAMVRRHLDAAINDPRPVAGSFSMVDVRRLSAYVIKLRDMPEGVLVLSGLSYVWKSCVCDLEEPHLDVRPTLQMLPFHCTPPAVADAVILNPTLEDLAASTSGATSSHVAKRTRSALAQSSGSTTRPSLFVGGSDDESDCDDDACVEIPLVTPLRSATVIASSGNQGRSSTALDAEGLNTRDSWGKGIMADDADAPSVEFTRKEWDAPYRPTFRVLTKKVFKDPAVCKTVVDQFPTPGEMSADSRLKGYEEKVVGAAGLNFKCLPLRSRFLGLMINLLPSMLLLPSPRLRERRGRKRSSPLPKVWIISRDLDQKFLASDEFSRVQGELISLATSVGFERGLSMHRTKDEFATISAHSTEPLSVILQLKPKKLARTANVPPLRDARVSPPTIKELTVTPASKPLELSTNADLTSSIAASEHNEEMGIFVALEDAVKLVEVGSRHASSDPNDVVVALSAGEKGDGLVPSSVGGEEAAANSSKV